MQRVDSVDVLRGLALIGMVLCHYPIFLSNGAGADGMAYFLANHLLGGDFAASWFVFLVGLSQVLSAKKRGPAEGHTVTRALLRGLIIFLVGLLFLLVIQGYEEMWDWDILTFIGATTVLLIPCRRAPSWLLLVFCCAVLFITPWLRSFIDIAPFYGGKFESVKWISDYIPNFIYDPAFDYDGGGTLFFNIIGFFLIGQFPLLPWTIFPVIGFVIGRRIAQDRFTADSPLVAIVGAALSLPGLYIAYAASLIRPSPSVANDYIAALSFYPCSYTMVTFLAGIVLILFVLLWRVYDAKPGKTGKTGLFLAYCRQMSRYSLTIYVTHFALIFIPLRIVQLATGKYYLKDAMGSSTALAIALVLLILYYPLLRAWDRAGGKYSFEWLLAVVLSPRK